MKTLNLDMGIASSRAQLKHRGQLEHRA